MQKCAFAVVIPIFLANACGQSELPALCSAQWQRAADNALTTGDGQGHGPDVGSDEWKSVIEFRLGVRGDADVPDRQSKEWCLYVEQRLPGPGA